MKKVSKEGNILIIDSENGNTYLNASWCSIEFDGGLLKIIDNGSVKPKVEYIKLSEFQDGDGNNIQTEQGIVTYLSDKIG